MAFNYNAPYYPNYYNQMMPYNGYEMMPFNGPFDSRMDRFDNRRMDNMSMAPFDYYGLHPYYNSFDRDFDRFFNRRFNRMMRDMDRFTSDLNLHSSRPSSMLEHYSLSHPINVDADGNRQLRCHFDMRSYKPEEVNVTLDSKNRFLVVEGTHDVQDKEHHVKRHYLRKVYIPEDVKVDLSKLDLKSCLNNEGLLTVEAALPKLSLEEAREFHGASKSVVANEPHSFKVNTKIC